MNAVERENILNGTMQKRFSNERAALVSDYTKTNARGFYYLYVDKPLSFLLRNSRDIFSESYFGTPFYFALLRTALINPADYKIELSKVVEYIKEAEEKRVPRKQLSLIYEVREFLKEKAEKYSNLSFIFGLGSSRNAKPFFNECFDSIYEAETMPDPDEARCWIKAAGSSIFQVKNPYAALPVGCLLAIRHPIFESMLYQYVSSYKNENSKEAYIVISIIRRMLEDALVREKVLQFKNQELSMLFLHMGEQDIIKPITAEEPELPMEIPIMDTPLNSVERVFEIREDRCLNDELSCKRYDTLMEKKDRYEVYRDLLQDEEELLGKDNSIVVEQCEDILCDIEAQISFLEWEDDGSPNPVIKTHIQTSKERRIEKEQKENKRSSIAKETSEELVKNAGSLEERKKENELCTTIEEYISRVKKVQAGNDDSDAKSTRCDELKEELDKKVESLIASGNYPKAKRLYGEFKIAMDDLSELEESALDFSDLSMDAFFEEDGFREEHTAKNPKKKPQKPKRSLTDKIQDKALDTDAKLTATGAKVTEKMDKLKNAGNAVSQTPKRAFKGVEDMVKDYDKWDENRRKKFFLKPGVRHKIFKKMKTALLYGTVANINMMWLPWTLLFRHMSKEKDMRIRNELARELDSEIKICEEKINDANSAGDTKQKYELMRIKDKLTAEKQRVRLNSKYI